MVEHVYVRFQGVRRDEQGRIVAGCASLYKTVYDPNTGNRGHSRQQVVESFGRVIWMKTPKRCRDAIFVSATRGLFEYRADDAFLEVSPDDPRLGGTVAQRNRRLFQLMDGVARLDLGDTEERRIAIFGDAYEYLMRMYASSARKSGGEHFTPPEVSRLLMTIALDGRDHVNKVYEISLPKLIQNQAA